MLCSFRPLRTTSRYQVLARTENRCGPSRHLRTIQVDYGEKITVPASPDGRSAVFARIEVDPSLLERARSTIYRAPQRRIALDEHWYRLVTDVASNGLLISLPHTMDFDSPFQLAANPTTIELSTDGGIATSDDSFQLTFFSMRIGGRGI